MKKALGKGLNALLPSLPQNGESVVVELEIGKIEPNPEQPRTNFNEEAIRQLADSIASVGVVQPIIVVDEGSYYKIIAGERRWRAARIAGLATIPAIVKDFSKVRGIEVALIENLQRQDLNAIEEANGYERLIIEYGYTQEKIAQTVGKSRPAIANAIRLLKLSGHIKDLLSSGTLTAGHARALLPIESENRRDALADEIVDRDLNVRQIEIIVSKEIDGKAGAGKGEGVIAGAGTGTGAGAGSGIGAGAGINFGIGAGTGVDESAYNNSNSGANIFDEYDVEDDESGDADGGIGAGLENATGSAGGSGISTSGGISTGAGAAAGHPRKTLNTGERAGEREAAIRRIEDELRSFFNTRVSLDGTRGKAGRIVIEYYDDDDLYRLLEQFGLGNRF